MPATHYKIMDWGDPVGEGVSEPRLISVSGVAKTSNPAEPHIVANEYICARLAAAVGLPVPPGFLVKEGDRSWFVSLNFNLSGEKLPPVIPELLVARQPDLCAGIVLFDAWALNPDRHAKNLMHYEKTDAVQLFDHSRALMPTDLPQREYAEKMRDLPAIGAHCLAQKLVDASTFKRWHQRIMAVAEHQITDALNEAVEVGLEPGNVDFFRAYLMDRRTRLPNIVAANKQAFPSLNLGTLPWKP